MVGPIMTQNSPTLRVCVFVFLSVFLSGTAQTCDLPVYRYALERWARDPCFVVCYAKGDKSKAETEIESVLDRTPDDGFFANVYLKRVAVEGIDKLHEKSTARKLWEQYKTDKLPLYVVTSPMGAVFYSGPLTPQDLGQMLSSPKRNEMSKRLCDEKIVFLFLRCGNAKEDEAAAAVMKDLPKSEVASEIVSIIELDRKDPKEAWLVRQLLAVEDDLADTELPMVFPVIGRGHLLPPYVGKGIAKENLEEAVMVLGGPCTCTVKAYLGGVDLLTNWNWEGAVYGEESGEAKPLPLGIQTLTEKPKPAPKVKPEEPKAAAQKEEEPKPTLETHVARNVAIGVGALVIVVGVLSVLMLRRRYI